MKKIETVWVCDDCGAPLPKDYIINDDFCIRKYNTALFPINLDCNLRIYVRLEVNEDYGQIMSDFCPKCRVKWLRKALEKFETEDT